VNIRYRIYIRIYYLNNNSNIPGFKPSKTGAREVYLIDWFLIFQLKIAH